VFWVLVGGGILVAFLIWISACGAIIGAVSGVDTAATPAPSSAASSAAPSSSAPVTASAPPATETTTAPAPKPEPTKTKVPKPAPEPKPDPVAVLTNDIKDELGDSNRDGVKRVRVKATTKAGKPITVKFAIDDNLTSNMIRRGARGDVVDILKQVRNDADWRYSEVVVRGTFSMQDKLGNAEEDQVVFARYSRRTVNKINFKNFLSDNIWDIADVAVVHPEFQ
jgi:hypothetical protein